MRNIQVITMRELAAYFGAPLAYVFIVIFLVMAGALTFYFGNFLDRGVADLRPFFQYHPWLYLLLMPAIGMRLWAEERKSGTLEFLMTLPITVGEAVVGKFLAAWIFAGVALALTFPVWLTVNYLGEPDNGVILASYAGSWLMAGGFLALSACASALTSNQVIAFVLAATICFLLMMSGVEIVQTMFTGWAPAWFIATITNLSVMNNFKAISEGVIDLRNLLYFVSLIAVSLMINAAIVEIKKAG
jgi:ABC-2 type transport system permease protein